MQCLSALWYYVRPDITCLFSLKLLPVPEAAKVARAYNAPSLSHSHRVLTITFKSLKSIYWNSLTSCNIGLA